jgi:hypothetical protein
MLLGTTISVSGQAVCGVGASDVTYKLNFATFMQNIK